MRRSRVLWKNSDIQEAVRKQLATVSNIVGEVEHAPAPLNTNRVM